ncbi:hypothetical protein [Stella sp.]|uniref:hypothetical protein n=1 Tax=Stella sp. TaxID=2912054 RepID=UPI0035B347D4
MLRRLVLALLLVAPAGAAAADRPFQPVGLWRFFHTDGSAFLARLHPDQSATTDFGQGEVGIWRWEGDRVRLYYTDGWDDLLYRRDGGFRKSGWAPGADRCRAPSNDTAAERLSDDPRAAAR